MSCTAVKRVIREARDFRLTSAALVLFMLIAVSASSAQATFTSLFEFDGTNGSQPSHVYLAQGTDGQLYGTASVNGGNGLGTAWKIMTDGAFTQLYSFCSQPTCSDGGISYAGLTLAPNGNFYGVTECDNGCTSAPLDGTIFEITPTGTYTVLHTFTGTDGSASYNNMTLGSDGNLYGTTSSGGTGYGNVFKISPAGKFTSIYSFTGGADGYYPVSRLFQGSNGNFYGTTSYGGNYSFAGGGGGTVFEITPAGKLTTLYSFCSSSSCPDGATPDGGVVQVSNGTIYGTTTYGGISNTWGTLYKLVGRKLTTLYDFCSLANCADGNYPDGGLIQATDGNFYGTTDGGGPSAGTVYEFIPPNTVKTLYSFCQQTQCADGALPYYGGLLQATDGNFYGTTLEGGISGALGTVYRVSTGLGPFVQSISTSAKVGASVTILGTNLTGATALTFGTTAATIKTNSGTAITTTVPAGATTALISVTTPTGTLNSNTTFKVLPQITKFSPTSGAVGTSVTITGVSLTQTSSVTFGGVKATSFTVNSDTEVTVTVPTGAKTGKIVITTPGGTATSAATFTVT